MADRFYRTKADADADEITALRNRVADLEEENATLSAGACDGGVWPDWATEILTIITERTGADWRDYEPEGIDIPEELRAMLEAYDVEVEDTAAHRDRLINASQALIREATKPYFNRHIVPSTCLSALRAAASSIREEV